MDKATYRVVNADGDVLLETNEVPEVVKEVYGNEQAYSVLKLGDDGEYHVDETDW